MKKNVCAIGGCSNEVPEYQKVCEPCMQKHRQESTEQHENELEELIPLRMHEPEESHKRVEKVNQQKLIENTKIIQKSQRPWVRWICFVNNAFTSAVIMSYKMKRGLCTCKDFEKHRKVCKHMLAAMVKIGKEQGKSLT